MSVACQISEKINNFPAGATQRVVNVLERYHLLFHLMNSHQVMTF